MISGSGSLEADGSVDRVEAVISGSGSFAGRELATDDASAAVSGSGSIRVSVATSLEARVSGSGSATYYGNPVRVDSRVSGSGSIEQG